MMSGEGMNSPLFFIIILIKTKTIMSKAKKQGNWLPKNSEGPHKYGGGKKKSGKHNTQYAEGAKPKGKTS